MLTKIHPFLLLFAFLFVAGTLSAQAEGSGDSFSDEGSLHVISQSIVGNQLHVRLGGRTVGAGQVTAILERRTDSDGHPVIIIIHARITEGNFIIIDLEVEERAIGPRHLEVRVENESIDISI